MRKNCKFQGNFLDFWEVAFLNMDKTASVFKKRRRPNGRDIADAAYNACFI